MATEVTCAIPDPDRPGRIRQLGGRRWSKDLEIVIADIEHGLEYYVQVGDARIALVIDERNGDRSLRSDPEATSTDQLTALPRCRSLSAPVRRQPVRP